MISLETSFFAAMSPELATFVLSMLPITELRASIPFALGYFQLPVLRTYVLSVVGSLIPMFAILFLLEPVSKWLSSRWGLWKRVFDWIFEHTQKKWQHRYDAYGALALMLFVAIPLPFTGVWSGSLAAFIFGVKKKYSMPFIALGTAIAGVLVTLISLGVFSFVL